MMINKLVCDTVEVRDNILENTLLDNSDLKN